MSRWFKFMPFFFALWCYSHSHYENTVMNHPVQMLSVLKCEIFLIREHLYGSAAADFLSHADRPRGQRSHGALMSPRIPSAEHQGLEVISAQILLVSVIFSVLMDCFCFSGCTWSRRGSIMCTCDIPLSLTHWWRNFWLDEKITTSRGLVSRYWGKRGSGLWNSVIFAKLSKTMMKFFFFLWLRREDNKVIKR